MNKLKSQIKRLETLERVFKCIAYFSLGLMWGLILSNRFTLWVVAIILSMVSVILSAICSWKKANREYQLGLLELKSKNQIERLVIHHTDKPTEIIPLEVDDTKYLFSEGEQDNER